MSHERLPEAVDRLEVRTNEIEYLASHSPLEGVSYVQVDRGPFQGHLEGYQLPSGFLWGSWANLGGVGQGQIPRGNLLCALTGPEVHRDRWHGRPIAPNSLALGNWHCGFHHRAGINHQTWVWLLPEALLLQEAEALGRVFTPVQEPLVLTDSIRLRATLENCLSRLQESGLADPTERLRQTEAALLNATVISLSQEHGSVFTGNTSQRIAAAARDYMHHWLSSPLRISELCLHLGVSERTLHYHFSRAYQCSPSEYHLSLRLKGVRRNLMQAEPRRGNVGQAAAVFGFWHMGRFGQQYRSLFGETPSQTLAVAYRRQLLASAGTLNQGLMPH